MSLTRRGLEVLHSDRHPIDDSRMMTTVLLSPLAVLVLVGPSALKMFDGMGILGIVAGVVSWLIVGFVIAVLVVATGAWVLRARID